MVCGRSIEKAYLFNPPSVRFSFRDGCSIKLDCYHEPSWSGRYMNFESHLPLAYKKNTVSLMTEKILMLSDPEFQEKNFQLLRNTLRMNAYPNNLVEDVIRKTKVKVAELDHAPNNNQIPIHGLQYEKQTVAIPYTKGLFENLKSICKEKFIVVGKGDNIIKRSCFSKLKDKNASVKCSLQSHLLLLTFLHWSNEAETEEKNVSAQIQHQNQKHRSQCYHRTCCYIKTRTVVG